MSRPTPDGSGTRPDSADSGKAATGALILAQWIIEAQGGDRTAFASIIRVHRPTVQRVALRLIGNHEDAEDIAQDTFVRAWRGLQDLEPGAGSPQRLAAWLIKITVHLCRDLQRRRGRRPEEAAAELIDGAVHHEPAAPGHRDPSQLGAQREAERDAARAIAALPERLRAPFVLRALEGHSYGTIAQITGVQPATVRTQMVQARRAMRRMLAGWADEETR